MYVWQVWPWGSLMRFAVSLVLVTVLAAGAFPAAAFTEEPAAAAQDQDKDKKQEKKDEEKGLPLKPGRKIEFTTDEGTWLSLDVSPDGKTIVFELLGDIYSLPIEGGQAKLISGGMGFDSQPRFSPDGQWVAFISDREGKNPLEDIHNTNSVHWVMKNGELLEGNTLDQVWSEQKKLEPLWFWNYDKPKASAPLSYGQTTTP